MIPDCRLGGKCDMVSRDVMLGREFPDGINSTGIAQCSRCSQVYQAQDWKPRACAHCNLEYGESLHDPCIRDLPNASGACCGHGDIARAFVFYLDGSLLRGSDVPWAKP